jgi:hypothetical protein
LSPNSFSGSDGLIIEALLVGTFGISFASDAFAADWMRDEDGFPVATLEQKVEGYIKSEKIAVGCAKREFFFERYSPAGNTPSSLIRFDDGTAMSVQWSKLDEPNTMWAYGELAHSIVSKLLSSPNTISFQEGKRAPVEFHFAYRLQLPTAVRARLGVQRPPPVDAPRPQAASNMEKHRQEQMGLRQMNWQEYSERMDNLQKQIAQKSEAQQKAQDTSDFANSVKLQNEIRELMNAADELKREARLAGLPV